MNQRVEDVSVEVDLASLQRSDYGSITGTISIKLGDRYWPGQTWIDFPVVVLSWWLGSAFRVISDKSRVWNCRFMDGPLSVRLTKQSDDTWLMDACRDEASEFSVPISCTTFLHSALDAAKLIVEECYRRKWDGQDIERLGSLWRNTVHDVALQSSASASQK